MTEFREPLKLADRCVKNTTYPLLKLMADEDTKDSKVDDKVASQIRELQLDLNAARSMMRSVTGDRPISVKMCADLSFTTTAATVYSTVATLVPGLAFGFTSFAAIMDEYRTTHVKIMVQVGPRVNIASPMIYPRWSMAIDFANNTACTSITDNLSHAHCMWGVMNTNGALGWPAAMDRNGLHTMSVKIPPGPLVDVGIVSELMGGVWVPSGDSAAIVAYLLPYFESGGGLSQFTLQGAIEYTVEWRARG